MKQMARLIVLIVLLLFPFDLVIAQTQPNQKEAATYQKPKSETLKLGKSYAALRPEQKRLIDDFIRNYNSTTGSKLVSEQAYDNARLSTRTTFDAVTHALLNAKITDAQGKSLGRAIDLVEAVDQVMGEEPGVGGDLQFRLYVYLKPDAFDTLSRSQEFFHDKDNSVYHKGFPICFRLKKGPPSIQFSISRDQKLSDVDVDYRSSSFPKALVNGHLSASNSDVRAGNNLDRHDRRWSGLNGWWRDVFAQFGTGGKPPKENATERLGNIPLNPGVKADQGVDKSAHDFLQSWVVGKEPNKSVAYFSRLSYPCLEVAAQKSAQPVPPGMIRLRTMMAMQKFSDSTGTVNSVADLFEPADKWSQALKPAKNSYASEFLLVSVPADMGPDEECVPTSNAATSKGSKEKYFATSFRGKQGDSRNKVMSLLWAQEGDYWKIVAIRIEDNNDAGIVPNNAAETVPEVQEPRSITGVQQQDSRAFAIMAVPDQKANSFLCQHRQLPQASPDLKPADAKYGAYYLSASRLNYGEEQSPALLLLWTKEDAGWKVVAWAVELP